MRPPSRCAPPASPLLLLVAALLATPATPLPAPVTVKATVDDSTDNVRIVLTHSAPVSYSIDSSRRKITVAYSESVVLDPAELRFDGAVLERIQQRNPTTVSIEAGPDYERFETFDLRNPQRLIVDLQPRGGSRGRAGSRRQPSAPPVIVVIDPGHGGIEHGAIGPSGLREKDVTLALARRLRLALQAAAPGVSVVLTRDEDRLVGLDERTAIANHNRADLLVSIHLNASPRADASGAETYYLSSKATDDEARILAAQENVGLAATAGGDQVPLDLVLWDLAQNRHIAESADLAAAVQRHLDALAGQRNRGVRQAPFRVLMGATMPAILVEVGFISNPQEEERFRSVEHVNRVVDAMAAAVHEFLRNLERAGPPGPGADPLPERSGPGDEHP